MNNNWSKYYNREEYEGIKSLDDMLVKAKLIIESVFYGVLDKGGNPYIDHLYAVSEKGKTIVEKTVGLLHDIIEDTIITKQDLEDIGFSNEVVEAVLLVTKDRENGETYPEFIDRIINSNNLTALNVKRYDMENNMDLSRISNPTEKDYKRNEQKYQPQYKKIMSTIERRKSVC